MVLLLTKDPTPKSGECGTCTHFHPDIVYTHKGTPLPAWHGTCALHPDTPCEQTNSCPDWKKL